MNEVRQNLAPAKWHARVTTIKCDEINEHVSILVKSDWTSHCTWYKQVKDPAAGSSKKVKPDRKTRRKIELCRGPLCSHVTGYRDQVINEEKEITSAWEAR